MYVRNWSGEGRGGAQLGFLCYSKVTFSASKRVSSYVSVMYVCIFYAILNNLARVIYVISNCHTAITCITGSINVNKQDDYMGVFEFGETMNFGIVF